jgi:hypothetical protein
MMEWRSASYVDSDTITCEINSAHRGWIPFTAKRDDANQLGRNVFADIEAFPVSADAVKIEAYRRIVAICPEWRQRNLTARAAILADKGRALWSADERAAWDAGRALWDIIDAIRAASDAIEAMTPIPPDYTDDKHW